MAACTNDRRCASFDSRLPENPRQSVGPGSTEGIDRDLWDCAVQISIVLSNFLDVSVFRRRADDPLPVRASMSQTEVPTFCRLVVVYESISGNFISEPLQQLVVRTDFPK